MVLIPIAVTALIIKVIIDWFDPLLEPAFEFLLGAGEYRTGMGLGALIVAIYIAGILTTHVVGRRIIDIGHRAIGLVPVVRAIYNTLRQATEVLSLTNQPDSLHKYQGVVLVDFPKEGTKAIGLVTAHVLDTEGRPAVAVFVPTTPIPTSGFLLIVNEDEAIPVDVTVDEAMKLIISGGILTPKDILHPRKDQAVEASASNH